MKSETALGTACGRHAVRESVLSLIFMDILPGRFHSSVCQDLPVWGSREVPQGCVEAAESAAVSVQQHLVTRPRRVFFLKNHLSKNPHLREEPSSAMSA